MTAGGAQHREGASREAEAGREADDDAPVDRDGVEGLEAHRDACQRCRVDGARFRA